MDILEIIKKNYIYLIIIIVVVVLGSGLFYYYSYNSDINEKFSLDDYQNIKKELNNILEKNDIKTTLSSEVFNK